MARLDNIFHRISLNCYSNLIAIEVVDAYSQEGRQVYFNRIWLNNSKGNVKVEDSGIYETPVQLEQYLSQKEYPIIVLVNGAKVLSKLLQDIDGDVFSSMLPNAKREDFCFIKTAVNDRQEIASLCKISFIDQLLQDFPFLRRNLINVSIGPSSIFTLSQFLFDNSIRGIQTKKIAGYEFTFDGAYLKSFNGTSITSLNTEEPTSSINIETERIDERLAVLYAYAIRYQLSPSEVATYTDANIEKNKITLFSNNKLRKIVLSALTILFVLLAVSTVFFNKYSKKLEVIEQDMLLKEQKLRQMFSNNKQIARVKELLSADGIIEKGNVSYYSDQVTKSLPSYIYLSKLDVNPNKTTTTNGKDVFDINTINISGYCYSSDEVIDWVEQLKKYIWVKNVIIKEYTQKKPAEIATFSISIEK